MLRSCDVLCCVQRLRQMQQQVRYTACLLPGVRRQSERRRLTIPPQHRYPHRLRPAPPRQLHHLLAHAHRLGHQETAKSHSRLHDDIVQRQGLLRLRRRAPHELRARLSAPPPRYPASRRAVLQGRARAHPERILGSQDHRLAAADCGYILDSGWLLHYVGKLRGARGRGVVPAVGADLAGGSGAYVGGALSGEG